MDRNNDQIPGGYILLSRKLLKSGIMEKPPLYLKLWLWMLMQASFKDHGKLKRGQFFTSLERMSAAMTYKIGCCSMKPSKKEIRGVVDFLSKVTAIVKTKVTHGMIITILKYDYYQQIQNYEGHSEGHNAGQGKGTILRKKGIKKDKYSPAESAKCSCPFSQILDLYHAVLPELPRVRNFTERRRKMLLARWNEKALSESGLLSNTLDFWQAFFKYISKSDFLMGRKDEWRANFEWIITKRNFYKIIEGTYHRG